MAKNKKAKARSDIRKKRRAKVAAESSPAISSTPIHPWRECPYGQHCVVTHALRVPPSQAYPDGHVVPRHFHCANNPSHKDHLYPNEISDIADQHFSNLSNMPCSKELKYGEAGRKYDQLIAGWTKYWNDILKPIIPLDSNLVKALIATESSFRADKMANNKNANSARGLMQITNETRLTLDNLAGEIKDHYVAAEREELNDPNINICAGIRWLFQKQKLATGRLGHEATWPEAAFEYKGLSGKNVTKKDREKIKGIFNSKYAEYLKCGKK